MKKINKNKRLLSRSLLAEERLVFLCEGSNQKLVKLLTVHSGLSTKQIALHLDLAPSDVFQRLQKMANFQLVFENQPDNYCLNQHKFLKIASLCQALNEPVAQLKRN